MELYSTVWHVLSAIIAFIVTFFLSVKIGKSYRCYFKRVSLLYFWHLFFCLVYIFYVGRNGGDALMYYYSSLSFDFNFSFGTKAVIFLTAVLSQGLGFSLLGCFLVFQFFGLIGLIAFDASLRSVTIHKGRNIKMFASLIVFLPSVSFWSSAIGKDAISFMAVGLALWAALQIKKRYFLMIFAVLLMLMVRPHMAAIMVLAISGSLMLQSKMSIMFRLSLALVSLGAVAVIVPFALIYAGVGETADVEQLTNYIDKRQSYNTDGGGGVDIAGMSFPMQLFTYMFRPLLFEARSIAALMAALDNMVLLLLFFTGAVALFKKKITVELKQHNREYMWFYSLVGWSILAMTSANLGIAMRQKWMIAPMLIFLLISVIGKERKTIS